MKTTSAIPYRLQLAAALALAGLTTSTVSAADFHFNVPSGDWNTPASWLENAVPGTGGGNFAFVNNGGVVDINATIPVIQDPFIGSGAGTSGTVNHSAGNHSNVGWTFIGEQGGTGTYNLTGPGNTLGSGSLSTGRIYLGGRRDVAAGGTGTMAVNTTGTVTATSDLSVGTRGGSGTLNITAGTVNANTWMIVGESQGGFGGGTGTVVQDGGNVTGGATDANGRFWVGSNEGGAAVPTTKGFYTINSGTLTVRNAIIGKNYDGTFTQNNGIVAINNAGLDSRLGEAAGSKGVYNMNNGLLTMGANFQIGASGVGIFKQTGGTVNASNFPVVGRFTGGNGTLDVSGGAFNQVDPASKLLVGEEGTGTLKVSAGGAVNVANSLTLGALAAGNGTVDQTGGTVSVANVLDLQDAGIGVYKLDGGTLSVNGSIEATNGTFTFTGGVLTRSNAGTITYLGSLAIGQNDATLKLDADKLFSVSGLLDVSTGVTFDVTGDSLPASGLFVQTGSIPLGTDGSILGTFVPATTTVLGLTNPSGATFITELAGETVAFDPSTQSVYWVQENAGSVTLNYSIAPVPEPAAFVSLLGGLATLVTIQRRRRR